MKAAAHISKHPNHAKKPQYRHGLGMWGAYTGVVNLNIFDICKGCCKSSAILPDQKHLSSGPKGRPDQLLSMCAPSDAVTESTATSKAEWQCCELDM